MRSRPCSATRQSSCASSALPVVEEVPVLVEQQVDARRRGRLRAGRTARRACGPSARREPAAGRSSSIRLRRKPAFRFEGLKSSRSSRLSNIFCEGCGRSGRLPSTEPRCAARSSRSSTCAPARLSAPSRRLLPLPVGPWMTRNSQRAGRHCQLRAPPSGDRPCSRPRACRRPSRSRAGCAPWRPSACRRASSRPAGASSWACP